MVGNAVDQFGQSQAIWTGGLRQAGTFLVQLGQPKNDEVCTTWCFGLICGELCFPRFERPFLCTASESLTAVDLVYNGKNRCTQYW